MNAVHHMHVRTCLCRCLRARLVTHLRGAWRPLTAATMSDAREGRAKAGLAFYALDCIDFPLDKQRKVVANVAQTFNYTNTYAHTHTGTPTHTNTHKLAKRRVELPKFPST